MNACSNFPRHVTDQATKDFNLTFAFAAVPAKLTRPAGPECRLLYVANVKVD
jgi:hypothetical protein